MCLISSTVSHITPVQLTTVRREQNRPNTAIMSRTQLKQRLQKEITELEERREQSPAADLEGGVGSRLGTRPVVLGRGTTVVGVPVSVFQVCSCSLIMPLCNGSATSCFRCKLDCRIQLHITSNSNSSDKLRVI